MGKVPDTHGKFSEMDYPYCHRHHHHLSTEPASTGVRFVASSGSEFPVTPYCWHSAKQACLPRHPPCVERARSTIFVHYSRTLLLTISSNAQLFFLFLRRINSCREKRLKPESTLYQLQKQRGSQGSTYTMTLRSKYTRKICQSRILKIVYSIYS